MFQLLAALQIPVVRTGVVSVLSTLLLSLQTSPTAFHKVWKARRIMETSHCSGMRFWKFDEFHVVSKYFFHVWQVIPALVDVFGQLEREGSQSSSATLGRLATLCHTLMVLHRGQPDTYQPLMTYLEVSSCSYVENILSPEKFPLSLWCNSFVKLFFQFLSFSCL